MVKTTTYTLITNNKIAYLNAMAFDFDDSETPHQYRITSILKKVDEFGKKILSHITIEANHYRNNLYINKTELKPALNTFGITGKGKEEVQKYVDGFNESFHFPKLNEEESIEFAKELAILDLMFTFQKDLVILSNPNKKNTDEYIFETLRPTIADINTVGELLFIEYNKISEENLLKCKEKEDAENFLSSYKYKLLFAVNELSSTISYSISPRIDVKSRCVNITSKKVFHLLWHIFVNYIVADVTPSKITFCPYCGSLREQVTKLGLKCKKCRNKKTK